MSEIMAAAITLLKEELARAKLRIVQLEGMVVKRKSSCGRTGPHCVNDPCPECGDEITGKWVDGSLVCGSCGVEVVAEALGDGSWTFSRLAPDAAAPDEAQEER